MEHNIVALSIKVTTPTFMRSNGYGRFEDVETVYHTFGLEEAHLVISGCQRFERIAINSLDNRAVDPVVYSYGREEYFDFGDYMDCRFDMLEHIQRR